MDDVCLGNKYNSFLEFVSIEIRFHNCDARVQLQVTIILKKCGPINA